MNFVIDAVLVIIVLFCIWRGFKNGLIRGVCGVIAIVISLFLSNLVATAYSGDFSNMLNPFVGGIVDKAIGDTITANGYGSAGSHQAQTGSNSSDIPDIVTKTLQKLGLPEKPTDLISQQVGGEVDAIGRGLSSSVTAKLCDSLAFVAVFAVCFLLLEIVFAVIGNLANLIFSLPGLEGVDKVAGCIFGLVKGVAFLLVIGLAFRYIGIVSSKTIDGTYILKYLINNNPLANILGI